MHHDAAKRQLFINKQEARQPVTLTNVNLAKSGMKFFNINTTSKLEDANSIDFTFQEKDASHGLITLKGKPKDSKFNVTGGIKWTNEIRKVTIKRNNAEEKLMDVRDGVIADSTWQIPISVWHNLIPQVQDNTWYNLTAVKIRKYQGERLATTDSTVITPAEINENLDWSTILKQVQEEAAATTPATPKLCCPVILGVNINVYAICNNLDKCKRKKVYPLPGEKTVKCTNCRKSMLLTRAPCGMTGEVFLEKGDQTMTLTIFPNTLTTYFQEHVLDAYKDNPEQLEERILNLTNLDITYNLKKIVTKIENHVD